MFTNTYRSGNDTQWSDTRLFTIDFHINEAFQETKFLPQNSAHFFTRNRPHSSSIEEFFHALYEISIGDETKIRDIKNHRNSLKFYDREASHLGLSASFKRIR